MKKSILRSGATLLAMGLSCTALFAGCAAFPEQKNNSLRNNGVQNNVNYENNEMTEVPSTDKIQAGIETPSAPSDSDTQSGGNTVQETAATDWYIRTDAKMYCNAAYNADENWLTGGDDSQQTVYISANGGGNAWVGVFKKSDGSFETPVAGYNLADTDGYRYALPAKDLEAGEYVAAVFPAEGAASPRAATEFSVTEGAVTTSKSIYSQNEEIVFSFYADTTDTSSDGGSYRWLGLYQKQENDVYGGGYLKWVTLCGNQLVSGQGYILQENKIGGVGWSGVYPVRPANAEALWEPGTYELVLFGDSGYTNVLDKAEFTVVAGKTGSAYAPESVVMNAYGAESGYLSGEVVCSFAQNRFNASGIVAYWADENGVLEGYLPFGEQRVTGNPQRCFVFENIMIPDGATHLRFYGKNGNGLGKSYFRVDLPENAQTIKSDETVLSEFTYLSDIHVGYTNYQLVDGEAKGTEVTRNSNNFRTALEDVQTVSGEKSDGVFIVGDVTESGRDEEWTLVNDIVQEKSMADSVYYMLGNHDYYGVFNRGDWQTGIPFADAVKPFTDWVAQKAEASSDGSFTAAENNLWYEAVTGNGVHHLVLNTESSDGDWVCAHLSSAQLNWLQTRLEALAEEDSATPVFVYLHQPLTDTTAGTMPGEGWDHVKIDGERGADALKEILNKHPNAFFVSGHNHRELDTYRAVFNSSSKDKTVYIQTGGTAYISKDITPDINTRHEGWYVRVYADKVVFLGREFTTGQWLSGACYVFELK